ncbi:MAG: carboxymuconolactone decarboxylase family protein [Dehalococcoidia bacterium]
MARVPLPSREQLSIQLQRRWDRMAARGPINIQRLFFASPEIDFNVTTSLRVSGLDVRTREILILRCAFLKRSTYEWHQHVRFAREGGLSDHEILEVKLWRGSDVFSENERGVLAYADVMHEGVRPSDEVFQGLFTGRTVPQVIAVALIVGHYFALAGLMQTFDIETEEPFIGWDLAGASEQT